MVFESAEYKEITELAKRLTGTPSQFADQAAMAQALGMSDKLVL